MNILTGVTRVCPGKQGLPRCTLYDPKTGSEFTNLLAVHALELTKLPQVSDDTPIWDWLRFIAARSKQCHCP